MNLEEMPFRSLRRIVVAIDPAVTATEDSDLTGIIVVARGPHVVDQNAAIQCVIPHCPGHGFVLDDLTCRLKPHGWAQRAVAAYHHWGADRIVAEENQGGDTIGETIHAVEVGVPYRGVKAYTSKRLRAEPASALYEQGRVHHLGVFPELESEQQTWTPDAAKSPDRLDALVHGLKELGLIGAQGAAWMTYMKDQIAARAGNAPVPAELAALPRLGKQLDVHECRCRPGTRRFFQGRCTVCQGVKPEE